MPGQMILLTDANTGAQFNILEDKIFMVVANGTGSKVSHSNDGAFLKVAQVTEAPSVIAAASTVLFGVAFNGATIYLNYEKINGIVAEGADDTKITFSNEGASLKTIISTDSVAVVLTSLYTKQNKTVYTINGVNITNDTFSVTGNQTATFVNGVSFIVFGSTLNDGTYITDSSSFGGGNTTITVTGAFDITDGTVDGFIVVGGN